MGVPRPASTVILLRDSRHGIETFLMRRAMSMAFAPDMHVFPGGRVDAIDYERQIALTESTWEDIALRASCDVDLARALYSCAIRETWEEARVRLADMENERWDLDPTSIVLFDHWVTPERDAKRYDVRFFMSELPADQEAMLATTEAVHVEWLRPQDALHRFEQGNLPMLPPTESVLHYLSDFADSASAVADARTRRVQPLLPRRSTSGAWDLVHAYSGEILVPAVDEPHTREDTGKPA